jgi:hypothetical protein
MGISGNILSAAAEQVNTLGKEFLSKLYPRDFELYMCAIELVDGNDYPVDYFMFPIMPKNIVKTEIEATTIQQSFNGITVFNKAGFIPDELNIQGDFGRSFKLMQHTKASDDHFAYDYKAVLASTSIDEGYYTAATINSQSNTVKKDSEFPLGIKTGYGCSKILQAIIDKSKAYSPSGRTYKLYFYNPALGENYLVVPSKSPLTWTQNEQSSNLIWQYSLSLIIIADLNDVVNQRPRKKQLSYAFTSDQLLGGITNESSLRMSYRNMLVSTRK